MSSHLKTVGLVIKPNLKEYKNILGTLLAFLARRGLSIAFLDSEQQRLEKKLPNWQSKCKFLPIGEFYKTNKLIISLGGDGTLLGVCRDAKASNLVLGINLGHLGFITEYSKMDFYEALEEIIKGKYQTYKRPLYKVEICENGQLVSKNFFINDIVIAKRDIARLVRLSIECEEDHIADLAGDGVIVSTPIGSTAYSLSAGGPILHPEVKAMVINPICAHGLNHRPLVIPEKTQVTIKSKNDSALVNLTIDGQINIQLEKNQSVRVARSGSKTVSLIKNPERNFFLTLKEKLTHGKR